MEVVRLGGLYDEETKIHQMGSVWDKNYLCPTIDTAQGGYRQPMIIEVRQIGNCMVTGKRENPNQGRVYDTSGLCPCINCMQGGNLQPMIVENVIVRQVGRNPENPTSRVVGLPTEQRLEPNAEGICGTLTSVQKDNMVMETVRIKQASETGVCRIEKAKIDTYSPYVNKKYEEFQEEHGYIPEFFNPYNKSELSDIAPTLTAQGESITKSGTVLKCDTAYRIRKLTPNECWRLMGFTDEDFHKAESVNSNTQLYKQAGNSIVVPVLEAIFRQMGVNKC